VLRGGEQTGQHLTGCCPIRPLLAVIKTFFVNIDDFVKSQNCDGKVKSSKFKAREFCVIR